MGQPHAAGVVFAATGTARTENAHDDRLIDLLPLKIIIGGRKPEHGIEHQAYFDMLGGQAVRTSDAAQRRRIRTWLIVWNRWIGGQRNAAKGAIRFTHASILPGKYTSIRAA